MCIRDRSSGDEEADMALLASLPGGPDKDEKDGKEDQDPSPNLLPSYLCQSVDL